jgi:hypothetical protein
MDHLANRRAAAPMRTHLSPRTSVTGLRGVWHDDGAAGPFARAAVCGRRDAMTAHRAAQQPPSTMDTVIGLAW